MALRRDPAWRLAAAIAVAIPVLSGQPPARAEPQGAPVAGGTAPKAASVTASPRASADAICRALAQAAIANDLPVGFFTRLIWQESRFDPEAVSSAGAMGIAQFMPHTAAQRGLADPFEPLQALRESASYLRELRATFRGSLGLAAAAYNAGPGRIEAWLAGRAGLPGETRAFVLRVTGHAVDAWITQPLPQLSSSDSTGAGCVELARLIVDSPRRRPALTANPAWGPWGVQLAGTWSEGRVLATYERLRRTHHAVLGDRLPLVLYARGRVPSKFLVRVSENSRAGADTLCSKLRAAGGACFVVRNPTR
jgi:hypothetical protein